MRDLRERFKLNERFDKNMLFWIGLTVFMTWLLRHDMPIIGSVHYRWIFLFVAVLNFFRNEIHVWIHRHLPGKNNQLIDENDHPRPTA